MRSTIEIINIDTIISESETLSTNTVSLDSARESIDYIIKEVQAYWQTDEGKGDSQMFIEGLEQNVKMLAEIVACNKDFAIAISNYAEAQKKQSEQTV